MTQPIMAELNQELAKLAKLMPSTEEGILAVELAVRAIENVTNERFKRDTIDYLKRLTMRPDSELNWIRGSDGSRSKHTPGPWRYIPSTTGGTNMAKVLCGNSTTFSVSSHRADGEADANARLIAASPDLLKALQAARAALPLTVDPTPLEIQINAAIAKATGGAE